MCRVLCMIHSVAVSFDARYIYIYIHGAVVALAVNNMRFWQKERTPFVLKVGIKASFVSRKRCIRKHAMLLKCPAQEEKKTHHCKDQLAFLKPQPLFLQGLTYCLKTVMILILVLVNRSINQSIIIIINPLDGCNHHHTINILFFVPQG